MPELRVICVCVCIYLLNVDGIRQGEIPPSSMFFVPVYEVLERTCEQACTYTHRYKTTCRKFYPKIQIFYQLFVLLFL